MSGLLVVTAVDAERAAVAAAVRAPDVTVAEVGAGPAESAARTAALVARHRPDLVLCAGIAGGFAPTQVGDVVVATRIVFADFGAELPDGIGFTDADTLGFGRVAYAVEPAVSAELVARTGARAGPVLTLARVTGTARTAGLLRDRFPDALAEAMEGAGVAAAASVAGVPFAELRAISNLVGPRDRSAWRIGDALEALGRAVSAVTGAPWST